MLTGESVPVSKVPIEVEGVHMVSDAGGEVPLDLSRHVVFSGTRVVRIRKTSPVRVGGGDAEALGMVLRTGECIYYIAIYQYNHCVLTSYSHWAQASTRPREHSFARCCFRNLLGQ